MAAAGTGEVNRAFPFQASYVILSLLLSWVIHSDAGSAHHEPLVVLMDSPQPHSADFGCCEAF